MCDRLYLWCNGTCVEIFGVGGRDCLFFFFKQKTAYEIVDCDWSSDVCSSDLANTVTTTNKLADCSVVTRRGVYCIRVGASTTALRSEERRVGKECRSRGSAYH